MSGVKVPPSGPLSAEIMIVGEAPGAEEEQRREPFVGASGAELNRMLHDAGISRSECFVTNVVRERPYNNDIGYYIAKRKKDITKDHVRYRDKWVRKEVIEGVELLKKEIELVKPKMIIAVGNTSLWALTGLWGITKWRGSMLRCDFADVKVIPTYHPAMILRQWEFRAIAVADIKRAARYRRLPYPETNWSFTVRPSIKEVLAAIERLEGLAGKEAADGKAEEERKAAAEETPAAADETTPFPISVDIETRAGHIACICLTFNEREAISIPFMCVENKEGYWNVEEEALIVWRLYKLLTNPSVLVIGQNFLYDAQYIYRHWHFVPAAVRDTMISHHTMFCALPKKLDFQASMYCDHYVYWKDDGKEWNKQMGENQLWTYNCEDGVRTLECANVEKEGVRKMGLVEPEAFQQQMFWPILRAMQRGVLIDTKVREKMAGELMEEMAEREKWLHDVLGHPINPRSPQQMQALFYDDLRLPIQRNRKTGQPTLDEAALTKLAAREPLIRPLVKKIEEFRSLGVFLGTFVQAPLDYDGRMRCSYNPCGTYTFRLSSSKSAFGIGTNLQNLPKGTEAKEPEDLELPNVRKMFVPDPGYTFFDLDLDRADLQVVVWEADDTELKQMLREGVDIHAENAKVLKIDRQLAKSWVHGTNYGGGPRTMAINCGLTVHQAEQMQKRWFGAHPGIKNWHERVEAKLVATRLVHNKFGYSWCVFDRVEGMLPEALAWIPQSTVGIYINKIWHKIHTNLKPVQVLLQVHDSLAGQFPNIPAVDWPARMREQANIVIPYDDPLVIPVGIKTSPVSWGDCK